MKRIQNLRRMSDEQLKKRHNENRNDLMRARCLMAKRADTSDSMFVRKTRKENARILTILSERRKGRLEAGS